MRQLILFLLEYIVNSYNSYKHVYLPRSVIKGGCFSKRDILLVVAYLIISIVPILELYYCRVFEHTFSVVVVYCYCCVVIVTKVTIM